MVLRRVYWLLGVLVWLGMGFIGYFGSRLDRLDYSEYELAEVVRFLEGVLTGDGALCSCAR